MLLQDHEILDLEADRSDKKRGAMLLLLLLLLLLLVY